ncbi:MAG: transglutaminase-like domain-containing protein [Fusicatenibacter sp.]|nr:transglutaminase-like domain-containing protein [Fusicatenibacter sp.]
MMFSERLQQYASEKFENRKKYYGPVLDEIEKGLAHCSEEEAVLLQFLYGTMPVRDAGEYDFEVFHGYVRHAVFLRKEVAWCRELPEDLFVNYVLYYRINSEDITDCRAFFYGEIRDRIAGMSLREAVLEINYWCAEHATYESTDGRTASPMTMYRSGKGRCGEESTFTVTALRSVGIAARQVYAPRWSHCDDNHAWVEVYIDGEWHFLGACEPEEILDTGWFSEPANRAVLVHTRCFSDFMEEGREELICREGALNYYNDTSFYARTEKRTIRVVDEHGEPVPFAHVAIEILNMAEFFPAAVMDTDEKGEVSVTVGKGDFRLRVWNGERAAEKMVESAEKPVTVLVLPLGGAEKETYEDEWIPMEIRAPKAVSVREVVETEEQKAKKIRRFSEAIELRTARFDALYDKEKAELYPEEQEILLRAGENFTEVFDFLSKDENPDRRRMLHALALKDAKDLKAEVLEDHLDCEQGDLPDDIYVRDLLCPRIFLEELTPWRSQIRRWFRAEEKEEFYRAPEKIWTYIESHITYDPEVEYETIFATPSGCLKMGRGSLLSKKILFVAICRSIGIPAHLDQVELKMEYFRDGEFHSVGEKSEQAFAALILNVQDESEWKYAQSWSIARCDGIQYTTLHLEEASFVGQKMKLKLEKGVYRLITTCRMPNGDQCAAFRMFELKAGDEKEITLEIIQKEPDDMLLHEKLPDVVLKTSEGEGVGLEQLIGEEPLLLAFLGTGEEPTEHVLNELLEIADKWNAKGARMAAVLRREEDLKNATLQKALAAVPGIPIFYDQSGISAKMAEQMQVDPKKLPLLVLLLPQLVGVYACAGYNVGSVGLMLGLMQDIM